MGLKELSKPSFPQLCWQEKDGLQSAHWRSESGAPLPRRVRVVDDTLTADAAYRLSCEGTALLWRGDFQNARQLLQAMARRFDRKPLSSGKSSTDFPESFHLKRMTQAQRSRILGMLLIPIEAGHIVALRRAPDVKQACSEAYGIAEMPYVVSLRELQGVIGAHEWRKKGVAIAELGDERIYPHYGVFSPVRGEYVALVAQAPLPAVVAANSLAFDVGTGTGILAAILTRRGIQRIVATDTSERALGCARENIDRLNFGDRIKLNECDLFPAGRASLIVCNPPWLPGKASSLLESAVYDPDSRMLRGFLSGLAAHLEPDGEGWLILSDLAEHLKLRSREMLMEWIESAGLMVLGKLTTRPTHGKAYDPKDPLHAARVLETTSLWRLGIKA